MSVIVSLVLCARRAWTLGETIRALGNSGYKNIPLRVQVFWACLPSDCFSGHEQ